MSFIPIYAPDIGAREEANVLDCLRSTWISSKGKYIPEFEQAFAKRAMVPYATGVCNGTVALHLALEALGIGPGDEVLVPTLTYVATANAVVYTGATPVFVDCDPDTWQMSVPDMARKITAKTRAVLPVHLYGGACDMKAILALAAENELRVVEDCAEAIGTYIADQHVGSFGDISTFSFFGNKTITTGEGGMVVTRDKALYDRAIHLRGQGLAADREYWHDAIGFNYRMTNICAAIGVAQLERVEAFLERKRALFDMFRDGLADYPVQFQSSQDGTTHSHWLISILVETSEQREDLRTAMRADGIETRPVFYPLHTLPIYAQDGLSLPVSEDVSLRGIALPSWPGLTDADIARIVSSIRQFFDGHPK